MPSIFDSIVRFLNAGIAGSQITPLRLLVVVVLMSALLWATRRITHWFVDHVLARRGVEVSLREALGTILRYGLIAIGALVILQGAGIDLTSLNVLIGAIGVGLGFGLQAVTSNFFSGLIILFERPIKIGQRIEIAGAVGEVREIAARATTLVTDENVAVIVPNSQFIAEPVTNWSRPNVLTGYVLTFHVAPASDPELVRRVLLAAAAAHADVRGEPAAEVEFVEIGPASLSFRLQVWSNVHLKTAGRLKSDLNFDVWKRLKAEGVAPPTATIAVTMSSSSVS
ncbi:MAG TPA: mechanosensitive ion channel domain-containing protein [Vicinamibacterales bacterium]|nr:mechanosensitive ion channel domain-containing protein [Vicinamibacterales bacterium]